MDIKIHTILAMILQQNADDFPKPVSVVNGIVRFSNGQ
jgi:hypothetical protein